MVRAFAESETATAYESTYNSVHAIIEAQETEAYKEINPTEEEERERPTVVESCKNKRHGKYNDRIDQIDDQGSG